MVNFNVTPIEVDMVVKIMISAFMGLCIGFERKGGPRGAGSRTFSFICMGSALFTMLSVWGFPIGNEPSRMAAQIVIGVGFIGAGVIWRQREEAIHGITTAASIWVVAAIGVAIALGFFLLSTVTTLITMFILARGHPIKIAKEHLHIREK